MPGIFFYLLLASLHCPYISLSFLSHSLPHKRKWPDTILNKIFVSEYDDATSFFKSDLIISRSVSWATNLHRKPVFLPTKIVCFFWVASAISSGNSIISRNIAWAIGCIEKYDNRKISFFVRLQLILDGESSFFASTHTEGTSGMKSHKDFLNISWNLRGWTAFQFRSQARKTAKIDRHSPTHDS